MDRNKNILRTFQAETDPFFKNAQAGHEKHGSYKKKTCMRVGLKQSKNPDKRLSFLKGNRQIRAVMYPCPAAFWCDVNR